MPGAHAFMIMRALEVSASGRGSYASLPLGSINRTAVKRLLQAQPCRLPGIDLAVAKHACLFRRALESRIGGKGCPALG
jgi:hypothetical protein